MTGPVSYALSANCATKSCLSVRAHIRKHADAMMLAVAAIEYLSPVEFAVRHKRPRLQYALRLLCKPRVTVRYRGRG